MAQHEAQPCTLALLGKAVAALAPPQLAESWDNVGLQVGDPSRAVRRVMTCLEVTPPVIEEAHAWGADALVAHHPLIFQPLKSLNFAQPVGELVAALVRADMGLVAAHTNLDAAAFSTNTHLAELLGLPCERRLLGCEGEPRFKFVVFVPQGHEQAVIDAIAAGGGGVIGDYTHCTFRAAGTGSFKGGEGSSPFIGTAGQFEQAAEWRIEAVVAESARARVLAAVRKVHPYQEMAHDWLPLAELEQPLGLGVVARVEPALTLSELVARCKERLGLAHPQVRLSGPDRAKIKRLAICSGSGGSFIGKAAAAADAYLTGEITYHHGIEAHLRHLPVIEIGHYESEVLIAAPLAERLARDPRLAAAGVELRPALNHLQPFRFV